nr:hypothetical protein [Streptomyces sp. NRRL F-2664]
MAAVIASFTASAPRPTSAGTFLAWFGAEASHPGQVQQHGERTAYCAHQCADRGPAGADDEVTFPEAWNGTVPGLGRSLISTSAVSL